MLSQLKTSLASLSTALHGTFPPLSSLTTPPERLFSWRTYDHVQPSHSSSCSSPPPSSSSPTPSYRMHVRESVFTESQDSQDAQCVVLLHGVVVSGTYMLPLGDCLAPYYRVFIPDLPGYGRSAASLPLHSRSLSVIETADVVAGWLEQAGLVSAGKRPPHFVGNSMGCQIVAELARRYPSYVSAGVLQGPTKGSKQEYSVMQVLRWLWSGRNERVGQTQSHSPLFASTVRSPHPSGE